MMGFDLDTFDFNWVSDFIDDDDDGGDGYSGNHSSPNADAPFLYLFSGCHTSDSGATLPPPIFPASGSTESTSRTFKERLSDALRRYFKFSEERHALVQVWAPVKNGGCCVLTTSGQPFVIGPQNPGLFSYRTVSVRYRFAAMEVGEVRPELGLPGRVFRKRLPEWTPNVQFYSSEEYPRLSHALLCDIQGSVAIPVFEPSGRSCIGVIEIIMTSMKINYGQEIDAVCKALEAVDLKCSEVMDHPQMQICNEGRQAALAEILEILTVVCETHKLPLAQTWVPCTRHNLVVHGDGLKDICSSFDGNCSEQVCMTATDAAFYVVDPHIWGFRDACAEHHLQKGQGVPGRAFATRAAIFSCDITQFSKTEYPLVHYARMFGLGGSLAIYLKSEYTGDDDYILEFFLTPSYKDIEEQQSLLKSLLTTMKRLCRNLRVVIDYELVIENIPPIIQPSASHVCGIADEDEITMNIGVHCQIPQGSTRTTVCCDIGDLQAVENDTSLSVEKLFQDPSDHLIHEEMVKDMDGNNGQVSGSANSSIKKSSSRRGKAEKSISLEVLQQHFAGSLKEAAKSLGVCPTTMKRICRQYGITRWPSRKIKKVNRSICKLQRVIESVPVAQGVFYLTSLKSPFPAAVGSQNMEHEPNLTAVQPDKLKAASERESLPEINEALETRISQSEKPEKRTSNYDHNGAQPTPLRNFPVTKRSQSDEQSIDTAASNGSSQNCPGNPQPTKLVAKSSVSCRVSDCEEVNFNGLIGLGLLPPGEPCPDINRMSNSVVRNEARQEMMVVKATYKEDLIRCRLAVSTLSLVELKEEIVKRLKLEVGTYDVKYLDDDQEWILLACEDDFKECIDISKSCGRHVIRLLINDVVSNLGSSCEAQEG